MSALTRVEFRTPHCTGAIIGKQEWFGDGLLIIGAQRVPARYITAIGAVVGQEGQEEHSE